MLTCSEIKHVQRSSAGIVDVTVYWVLSMVLSTTVLGILPACLTLNTLRYPCI